MPVNISIDKMISQVFFSLSKLQIC